MLAEDLLREAATQEEAHDEGAALALLERALALHPSRSLQAKALRGLARINDRQGNASRALGYYGRLKPLAPRDEAAVIDERIKLLAEEVGQ